MKYELDNGRTINIPDKDIERLQNSLGISFNEAVYTWLEDEGYYTNETVEELSKKAEKNRITATIHQAKAENGQKKERKPREKKENKVKQEIISAIFTGLKENLPESVEISITNDEKYIEIVGYGSNFTINLVQHRSKK